MTARALFLVGTIFLAGPQTSALSQTVFRKDLQSTGPHLNLSQEFAVNVIWQWDNDRDGMVAAMQDAATGNNGAGLDQLKHGQRHNPHVQQVYQSAFDTFGAEQSWERVETATYKSCDWNKLANDLNLEKSSNLGALNAANTAWKGLPSPLTPVTGRPGFADLLAGQHSDASAMSDYRACWAADKERVRQAVAAYFQ